MKKSMIWMVAGMFSLAATMLTGDAMAGGKTKKKTETVAEKFKRLDTNNDGKISKEEFKKFEPNRKKIGTSKKTTNRDRFNQFDKNNDGFISSEEFQRIFEYEAKK